MNKKMKIVLIIIAVILVGAIIILSLTLQKKVKEEINKAEINTTTEATTETVVDQYREAVPENIVVPEEGAVMTEEQAKEIAVPAVVVEAAPGSDSSLRVFNIRGEGGAFTPSQVIAYVNDIIHVNFTAVDRDYDIKFPSYNMGTTATKGQTKVLEFQALAEGKFQYFCSSCGENTTALGYMIVAPKK